MVVKKMPDPLRFICYGLGKVGKGATKMLLSRSGVELVGAIDVAPNMVGKDAGEVLNLGRELGVTVSDDPEKVLSSTKADVIIIATRSWMADMYPALSLAIKHRINVVTSSTELSYIWANLPEYSGKLDKAAKEAGISILGTGFGNYFGYPFIVAATGASETVEEIHATMIGDTGPPPSDTDLENLAAKRMLLLGSDPEDYNKSVNEYIDTGGHQGKGRSGAARAPFQLTALVADTFGWKLDSITSAAGPYTSKHAKKFGSIVIEPGQLCGYWARMTGVMDGKEVISHYWRWQVDPEQDGFKEGFNLDVKGNPNLKTTFEWDKGQITDIAFGMSGTWRAVANAVPYVVDAPKGLTDYMHLPYITTLPLDVSKFGSRLNDGVKEVFIRPGSPEVHPKPNL
jgi:4-hydroxy-tetrahydrodipicolinate reductase